MIEYGYRHNEWLAVYVNNEGEEKVVPFNTFDEACAYIKCFSCKIGVMTTSYYYHKVKNLKE